MFELKGVKFDAKALDHFLNDPEGDVGQYLRRIGLKIRLDARAMVGVRTGQLRSSIHVRQARNARSQYVVVGSDVKHALMHHEGTKPHVIKAHQGRVMRFYVGGKVVYAQRVNHPGTAPRKYLTVPMKRHVR